MIKEAEKTFYSKIIADFFKEVKKSDRITIGDLDFSDFMDKNYVIRYGASKIALIPKQKGARYVIKLPLRDYVLCEAEEELYQLAKEKGIEEFFPDTFQFDEVNGIKVFLQERAKKSNTEREFSVSDDEIRASGVCNSSSYNDFNFEVSHTFMDEYGIEKFKKLLKFCEENKINDIHNNNYGFLRGRPVLIDFSGFHGSGHGTDDSEEYDYHEEDSYSGDSCSVGSIFSF